MRQACLLLISILGLIGNLFGQVVDGSVLFTTNCTACHTIGSGRLVGPDLEGVNIKYEQAWLLKFIRSSQQLVNAGDERALAIFNEFNMIPMPDQPFGDEEIKAMLAHIASQSEGESPLIEEGKTTKSEEVETTIPDNTQVSWLSGSKPYILIILGLEFVLIAVLITIAIVLTGLKKVL